MFLIISEKTCVTLSRDHKAILTYIDSIENCDDRFWGNTVMLYRLLAGLFKIELRSTICQVSSEGECRIEGGGYYGKERSKQFFHLGGVSVLLILQKLF